MEQMLAIILSLNNPLDYQAYVEAANQQGVTAWSMADYAQKLGLIQMAVFYYPTEPHAQAFTRFILDLKEHKIFKPKTTSCCGGGITR